MKVCVFSSPIFLFLPELTKVSSSLSFSEVVVLVIWILICESILDVIFFPGALSFDGSLELQFHCGCCSSCVHVQPLTCLK